MKPPPPPVGLRFWAFVATRVLGIFVVGLALIELFREVVVPVLRGDVERIQEKHAPSGEPTRPPDGRAVGGRE